MMHSPEELLRRLKPVINSRAERIWKSYVASGDVERKEIRHSLENMHSSAVEDYKGDKIVLAPPDRLDQLFGEYPLGMVWYAGQELYPFALSRQELTEHIGIFGRTGAGKSYLVRGLLLGHLREKVPFLLLDWKGTYTDIEEWGVKVIQPGSKSTPFQFNPLSIQGIHSELRKTYHRQVVELFVQSYLEDLQLLTSQGVEFLVLRAIDALPKGSGFARVYEWVRSYKGAFREMDWKVSCANILYKLVSGPLGRIMCEGEGQPVKGLMGSSHVLELHNLGSSADKAFFVKTLLLRLYYHLMGIGPSRSYKLFVVIEEAHNILLRHHRGKESTLELLFRQVREFGVGLAVVDQHPSLISPSALGTYCTVSFNLKLKEDRLAMASALALDDAGYINRLPPRFAIVKIQNRFQSPFLIRSFDLPVADIRRRAPPAVSPRNEDIRVIREQSGGVRASMPQSELIRVLRKSCKREVSGEELLLVHTYVYPLKPTTKRYAELGLNGYQGNRLRKALISAGHLKTEDRATKTGMLRLLLPRRSGFEWLESLGYHTGSAKLGGLEHGYWKRRVSAEARAIGLEVKEEHHIGAKRCVDLLLSLGTRKVGVEVETGKRSIKEMVANQEKCRERLDGVVTLASDPDVARRLLDHLPSTAVTTDARRCVTIALRLLQGEGS